jgi:hypothetical protein
MNDLQEAYEQGMISDENLFHSFRAFYDTDPLLEGKYQTWVAAYPKSYAAHLAHSTYYRFANQLVGFTVIDYPWTESAFAWGVALGAVAVLATLAGQWTAGQSGGAARVGSIGATFLAAFAVYEVALFAISIALLGGTEVFTGAIQGRIFAINAMAFVGLLALHRLAVSVGLVAHPGSTLSMTEGHA